MDDAHRPDLHSKRRRPVHQDDSLHPDGIHRVGKLSDVVEHFYEEVKAECNANHLVGMGWLAVPGTVEVSERQVAALLSSIGA
jgi:hypothetical protein